MPERLTTRRAGSSPLRRAVPLYARGASEYLRRVKRYPAFEFPEYVDWRPDPQVQAAFKQYKSADKSVLQGDLDKAIQQAQSLGVDPESTNKVKELRQQIAESAVDVVAMAAETWLLGFHPLLLPTFAIEFIPVVDAVPTWTACVAAVIAMRKRAAKTSAPPEKPPIEI